MNIGDTPSQYEQYGLIICFHSYVNTLIVSSTLYWQFINFFIKINSYRFNFLCQTEMFKSFTYPIGIIYLFFKLSIDKFTITVSHYLWCFFPSKCKSLNLWLRYSLKFTNYFYTFQTFCQNELKNLIFHPSIVIVYSVKFPSTTI